MAGQFCESCGAPLKEGDQFCEQCGAAVAAVQPAAAPSPAQVQEPAPVAAEHGEKNPILALILSFICSGLGQIYNGDTLKGVALFFGTLIGYLIFPPIGLIVLIYGMYDAYMTAKKMNAGTIPSRETDVKYMIGFLVMALIVVIILVAAIGL